MMGLPFFVARLLAPGKPYIACGQSTTGGEFGASYLRVWVTLETGREIISATLEATVVHLLPRVITGTSVCKSKNRHKSTGLYSFC